MRMWNKKGYYNIMKLIKNSKVSFKKVSFHGTVEWVVGTVVLTRDGCSDLGRLCLLGTVVLELTQNYTLTLPNVLKGVSPAYIIL